MLTYSHTVLYLLTLWA